MSEHVRVDGGGLAATNEGGEYIRIEVVCTEELLRAIRHAKKSAGLGTYTETERYFETFVQNHVNEIVEAFRDETGGIER